jgi:toxin ParE1/3/4
MVKIIWTNRAFGQFERLIKYIREEQGLAYAKIVHEKILQSVSSLEKFPLLGMIEPALVHKKSEYRFLVVWSLKIIYRVDVSKVVISRYFTRHKIRRS